LIYSLEWQPHSQHPAAVALVGERLALGNDIIFDRTEKSWMKWPVDGPPPAVQSRIYLNFFPTVSEAVLAYTAWTSGIGWHDFPASVFTQAAAGRSVGGQPN
jgi:hypothetical protein